MHPEIGMDPGKKRRVMTSNHRIQPTYLPSLRCGKSAADAGRLGITMRLLAFIITLFSSSAFGTEPLLLFGGKSHDVFLGCTNCGKYDDGSICNKYGDHGSEYQDKSIWNKYQAFGSQYSDTSPWNKYAAHPPVIVDKDGGFYGYFASNKYQDKRTAIKSLVSLLDNVDVVNEDLEAARDWLCE